MSDVAREELITRYIMESSWVRKDGSLRWTAFKPRREKESRFITLINQILRLFKFRTIETESPWTTSIYRISGLSDNAIWDIGFKYVATPSKKELLGRGDFIAANVYDENLRFDPNDRPHKGHADIIDWPEEQKDRKSIADALSMKAGNAIVPPANYAKASSPSTSLF